MSFKSKQVLAKLDNVTYSYNDKAVLKNASLTIYEKDFIGVIGPNGGGKTTAIKLLLKLLKPQKGRVVYNKKDLRLGYLPQYSNIDKRFPLSVVDVVLSGLMQRKKLFKRFTKVDHEMAHQALNKMGVAGLNQKHIGSLSGGQMQKVLLARAIVSCPDLLILDEPETYVDSVSEAELYETLKSLNDDMAIVVVSHDLGLISTHIKSIVCINKELHYHDSNQITEEQLAIYGCPIQLITHGNVPHTVLKKHD